MCLDIFGRQVVDIVGGHTGDGEPLAQRHQRIAHLLLLREVFMALKLEEEVLCAKEPLQPLRQRCGGVCVASQDGLRNLAAHVAGEGDEPLVELLQIGVSCDGASPLHVGRHRGPRHQAYKVAVAIEGLGKQHQMVEPLTPRLGPLGLHIQLRAEDGPHPRVLRILLQLDAGVEHAVIRDGHRVHPQLRRPLDQRPHLHGGIQHGVVAVNVQVNE